MTDARTLDRLTDPDTYRDPQRECDVVMKGGITSGVLYPLAACELAAAYRFRSVGGTSAGAIAAAAAAAAEYGRGSDRPGAGFVGLAKLPSWLSEDDHLVGLFQPSEATSPYHGMLLSALGEGSKVRKLVRTLWATTRHGLAGRHAWMPILGLLLGVYPLVALLASPPNDRILQIVAVVAVVVVALAGLAIGGAISTALRAGRAVTENGYGLVSGSDSASGEVSLCDWLTDYLDELAGRDASGDPLTFSDLWEGPPDRRSSDPMGDPAINLQMQTTSLTEGRPYRLPDDLGSSFAFREDDFRRIFPDRVVDYLIRVAPEEELPEGLVALPKPGLLPIVVATRMSLSFPILISAVPLHGNDWSLGTDAPREPVWFSDGGITSNFPVSYFDRLLPSRPTFAINLRPFHRRYPQSADECQNVFLPPDNRSGQRDWWTRWPAEPGLGSVGGFLRAIADTMQNWVDNQQILVPGYRDRTIHISHNSKEGGMNLTMPPEILDGLAERGRCAGAELVHAYTTPPDGDRVVSWENHRRIRLLTGLSLVQGTLTSLAREFDRGGYGADLLADPPPSYEFNNRDQAALAEALIEGAAGEGANRVMLPAGLRALADAIESVEERSPRVPLWTSAPKPAPALRVAPGARAPRQPIDEEGDA